MAAVVAPDLTDSCVLAGSVLGRQGVHAEESGCSPAATSALCSSQPEQPGALQTAGLARSLVVALGACAGTCTRPLGHKLASRLSTATMPLQVSRLRQLQWSATCQLNSSLHNVAPVLLANSSSQSTGKSCSPCWGEEAAKCRQLDHAQMQLLTAEHLVHHDRSLHAPQAVRHKGTVQSLQATGAMHCILRLHSRVPGSILASSLLYVCRPHPIAAEQLRSHRPADGGCPASASPARCRVQHSASFGTKGWRNAGPSSGAAAKVGLQLSAKLLLLDAAWLVCSAGPLCVSTAAMPHVTAAGTGQTYGMTTLPAQSKACATHAGSPHAQGDSLTAPASCIFSNGTLDVSVSARILNSSAASCTAPAWDFSGPGAALSLGLATSTCTLWQVPAPRLKLERVANFKDECHVPGRCMDAIHASRHPAAMHLKPCSCVQNP